MPLVILACRVLQRLLEPFLQQASVSAQFLDYGYHRVPQQMTPALQTLLEALPEPSTVLIGYGLCGNGLAGLQAGRHTLVVPRADDCIALLLGSYERYRQEFDREPGTYYLTRGWLESGSHPLKEHHELLEKYDPETADFVLDEQYRNYRRLVLLAATPEELEICREPARAVAEFCAARWGLRYEEHLGSDDFAQRLFAAAQDPASEQADILIIPPGGEVRPDMFWRL